MATPTKPKTYAERADESLPNWAYQVPGALLMIGGFGGLAFLSLF